MKKTTYYLTGQHTERYEPELSIVANKRIDDMSKLLNKLRFQASTQEVASPEYRRTTQRYADVEEAIEWWRELITGVKNEAIKGEEY